VRVTFADGTTDHVEAKEYHPERHIRHNDFKGQLASTQSDEAVLILAKADGQKDLVVFKSVHSPDCSVFSVDLEGEGVTECVGVSSIKDISQVVKDASAIDLPPPKQLQDPTYNEEFIISREVQETSRSVSKAKLDPHGYKLTVALQYDDLFKEEFKEEATDKADAVMEVVTEMFSRMQPPIEIDVVKVKHAEGQDWGFAPGWSDLDAKSLTATCFEADCYDANLYVLLTGSAANLTALGVGLQGVVCSTFPEWRISLIRYQRYWDIGLQDSSAIYHTARVIAHEMGHNMGLGHDDGKEVGGRQCKGYMGTFNTGAWNHEGWSECNAQSFQEYFNDQVEEHAGAYRSHSPYFCLPLKNLGKPCLAKCNNKSGLCGGEEFCGAGNYCCKEGVEENGCDGKTGGQGHHICVEKPIKGTWTPTFKACLKGKERSAKRIRNVASFDDCKLECEKDLTCKSILYGEKNKLCNLFIFNRESAPEYFQAPCSGWEHLPYAQLMFEKQNWSEPTKECIMKMKDKTTGYITKTFSPTDVEDTLNDRVIDWVASFELCKFYCETETSFECKSVEYNPRYRNRCHLSTYVKADDGVAILKPCYGMSYSEVNSV